jgi:hypothetical protein
MIKTKTINLKGAALDWAVAQIEDIPVVVRANDLFYADSQFSDGGIYCPSVSWDQGGPIIDKYDVFPSRYFGCSEDNPERYQAGTLYWMRGETPLMAAMRSLVASKFGDEIDVPESISL